MLYIASHIKRFEHCNTEEAYDINNGLLLCANADALFDKHMITVDSNKKIKFSFLIERDFQLQQNFLLNQPVFEIILNEERMKYMSEHRAIFEETEKKRMAGDKMEDDDFDATRIPVIPITHPSVPLAAEKSEGNDPNYTKQLDLFDDEKPMVKKTKSYKELTKTAKVNEMTDDVIRKIYDYDKANEILKDYQRKQIVNYITKGKELTFNQKLGMWYVLDTLVQKGVLY